MGIRKLRRFIDENIKESIRPSIFPVGSKLIIDGNGFLFYILNNYEKQRNKLPPVERKYGGDFYEIYKRVKEEVKAFLTAGIIPIVYWDGKRRRLKLHTDMKRRHEILDAETKLFEHCIDGVIYNETEYPLPVLAKYQIQYVIKEFNIEEVFCSEEADHVIAKVSADNVDCFIYGNDSDFYVFKDARYVIFGSFFTQEGTNECTNIISNKNKNVYNQLKAVVYTRKNIANWLGMSEKTFVDFVIYLGNDYTSHFSKREFLCKFS